ncbi:uncharacterized protein BJ171DRAFT_509093 [Polychytrium aggregatum]|uniref:uncharacterized protein n=1 Tax=Polychytrium aggregatum TaxID=110093 RepID=UPI0022FEC6A2|nr:uncharacterized protein BJ171DRAFT_509093 [Polychytrium aggregatum]KAI9203618.1 hypothetical protein BJ171DRAFT_509093 [Polychytrium aggregatum]
MSASGDLPATTTPDEAPRPIKRTRNKRACDTCRIKRNKCSGGQPCSGCQDFGIPCTYNTPMKKRGPQVRSGAQSTSKPRSSLIEDFPSSLNDSIPTLAVSSPETDGTPSQGYSFTPRPALKSTEVTAISDINNNVTTYFGRSAKGGAQNLYFKNGVQCHGIFNVMVAFRGTPILKILREDSFPFSRSITYHFVHLYFEHISPCHPVVDRSTFYEELEQEYHTEPFSLLLWVMCTLITLEFRSLEEWGLDNIHEERLRLANHSYAMISKLYDHPHINVLQALLMMSLAACDPSAIIKQNSYYYMGLARSMAIELGLHLNLDDVRVPPPDRTVRRIQRSCFFALYTADRYSSLVMGRPISVRDDSWDSSLLDEDFDDMNYRNLVINVRMCKVLGRLITLLNSPGVVLTSPEAKELACQILMQLQHWFSSLPAQYRGPPTGRWSIHYHYHTAFHSFNILLQRIIAEEYTTSAIDSAHAIVRYLRDIPAKFLASSFFQSKEFIYVAPITSYVALTAANLFLELILSPGFVMNRLDDASRYISELNEILLFLQHLDTATSLWLRQIILEGINWNNVHTKAIANGMLPTISDSTVRCLSFVSRESGVVTRGEAAPSGLLDPLFASAQLANLGGAVPLVSNPPALTSMHPRTPLPVVSGGSGPAQNGAGVVTMSVSSLSDPHTLLAAQGLLNMDHDGATDMDTLFDEPPPVVLSNAIVSDFLMATHGDPLSFGTPLIPPTPASAAANSPMHSLLDATLQAIPPMQSIPTAGTPVLRPEHFPFDSTTTTVLGATFHRCIHPHSSKPQPPSASAPAPALTPALTSTSTEAYVSPPTDQSTERLPTEAEFRAQLMELFGPSTPAKLYMAPKSTSPSPSPSLPSPSLEPTSGSPEGSTLASPRRLPSDLDDSHSRPSLLDTHF